MADWLMVIDDDYVPELFAISALLNEKRPLLFTHAADAIAWIEAVERASEHSHRPALALITTWLDHDREGGIRVAQRLRHSPFLKDIAIALAETASLNPKEEAGLIRASGTDMLLYIPLPKWSELGALLDDLVERKQKETASHAQRG